MKIKIASGKYGIKYALMDDEDYKKLEAWSFYVWTTSRHTGFYLMGYKPGNPKPLRVHRIILDAKEGQIVDHINGDPLDNRRANLRLTDASGNNKNAAKRRNALTSKYKGVHKDTASGKYKAQIQHNKKKISIGTYSTEEEAANAYNIKALQLFGAYRRSS